MGSVCLSLVPILRCVGLSQIETKVLLLPPALEVVFSLGLVFAGRAAGRKRFVLAAEGPFYFFLALLEYLSHATPTFHTSVAAFKGLDIFIGAVSFIPILLFTSYLYLYKRKEIFPTLPRRFMLIARVFALVVIPFIVIANEIGAFVGITYHLVIPVGGGPLQMAISEGTGSMASIRTFFESFALALFAVYEFLTFLAFFLRLTTAFVKQNRIEASAADGHTVLFKGTGWLGVGVKLCAIESAIGFANGSFGLFFTRRVLRMLGRACIIIGVVKGPDEQDDYNDLLTGEKYGNRRGISTRRINISGPHLISSSMVRRMSRMLSINSAQPVATFGPQPAVFSPSILGSPYESTSPTETAVTSTSRATHARFRPVGLAPDVPFLPRPASVIISPAPAARRHPYATNPNENGRLVTVARTHGRAPTLILRISQIEFPSPATIAAPSHRSPNAERRYSALASPPMPSPTDPRSRFYSATAPTSRVTSPQQGDEPRYRRQNMYLGRERVMSASSLTSDSLDIVRDLSSRFSGLPPRVTGKLRGSILGVKEAEEPDPMGAALLRHDSDKSHDPSTHSRSLSRGVAAKRKPPPELRASMLPNPALTAGGEGDELSPVSEAVSMASSQWIADNRGASRTISAPTIDAQGYRRGRRSQRMPTEPRPRADSTGVFEIDWISNPSEEELPSNSLGRIKSVGRAPRRSTPTPTRNQAVTRGSVSAEQIMLPPDAVQKVSKETEVVRLALARKDSDVLSAEDAEIVRRRTFTPIPPPSEMS